MTTRATGLPFEFTALGVGLVVGVFVLDLLTGQEKTNYEDLALGDTTRAQQARVNGTLIHCKGFPRKQEPIDANLATSIDDCILGSQERGASRVALWLGNSQVHAINGYKPGDVTAAGPLHRDLAAENIDFITISYPNANQQEHLATYAYVKARLPLRFVVLALVFDDFRETGIRSRLEQAVRDPKAHQTLGRYAIGRDQIALVKQSLEPQQAGTPNSLQARSEDFLTSFLSNHSEVWAVRGQARGKTFQLLHQARNALFDINPQSVRRVIPSRYAKNRAAVRAVLQDGARTGVKVLGYIVPLRTDITPPYDPEEYRRFTNDMRELFAAHGGYFRNLEDLVPARHWGLRGKEGHIDFMHFRAAGHELVAQALAEFIRDTTVTE